jgi:uncharacterized protein
MDKLDQLINIIKKKQSLIIAFSGGIDSSLVAKSAFDVLKDRAVAITIDSEVFPEKDLKFAEKIAKEIGINHRIIHQTKLASPAFAKNTQDRCFYCKKKEMDIMEKLAKEYKIKDIAYGVNLSDQNEHRPGISALKKRGAFFPLQIAGIGKPDIPKIAEFIGLSNYNMPSTTCLASRIPYGTDIDVKKLILIEQAEDFLFKSGIHDSRVRVHGDMARIEVGESEMHIIMSNNNNIVRRFKSLGFKYISLDLQGYRSGSMDEVLSL